MKINEVLKILKANGWELKRHGKRHDIYYNQNKPGIQIPIPRHGAKEVPDGTLKSIMELAGL